MSQNSRNVRRIAFGGILSALSLSFLLLSGLIPAAEYTCPALGGMILTALVIDFGKRTAWLSYGAVSLLGLLLSPNREAAVLFVCFFGFYPILKSVLEGLASRPLEWCLKVGVFNAAFLAAYWLMVQLFGMAQLQKDLASTGIFLLLVGNLVFLLYDRVLSYMILLYCQRIRPRLQRLL